VVAARTNARGRFAHDPCPDSTHPLPLLLPPPCLPLQWITWDGPGWDYARTADSPRHLWSKASDAPEYLRGHPSFQSEPPPRKHGTHVAWCDADPEAVDRGQQVPMAQCTCNEGMIGRLCHAPVLHACLNQCNGRGTCVYGYCECDASWYGVDCSMRRGAIDVVQPLPPRADHAAKDVDYSLGRSTRGRGRGRGRGAGAVAATAAAVEPLPSAPQPTAGAVDMAPMRTTAGAEGGRNDCSSAVGGAGGRPSPAIFVYELPIEFNVQLWTLKSKDEDCALRAYTHRNSTDWKQHAFGMEVALHERLLHSPHRVSDPALADFFYVPVWGGCWLSRFSRPTPRHHDLQSMAREDPEVKKPRAARASDVYRRAFEHIRAKYPFWNRSKGADHLWTFPHDEGACLAPVELSPSILVSHWGRLQLRPPNHTSTSSGQGWHVEPYVKRMYGSLRCFEPGKDALLPIFKSRNFVQTSPFVTGRAPARNVLFNFRGNAHLNQPQYSMGLRQQLYTLLANRPDRCVCADPGMSGRDVLGARSACNGTDVDGCLLVGGHSRDYIADLQRSVFCGVLPGNGWGHIEEPVIHGCIPVIVMPEIHVQLEGQLDLSKFTIRIDRSELPRLVETLRAVPPARVAEMQAELAKVWERFTYSGLFKREFAMQDRPPHALTQRRVGVVPTQAEQRARIFMPLEPRLRGIDAVDTLVEHLRLRLVQRRRQQAGCAPAGLTATRRPHAVEVGWAGAPPTPTPFVDHGPPAPLYPAVNFHVWTNGVQ
jgi:hypothetical protein